MIKQIFLQDWRKSSPWIQDVQVEQDLIICRALVSIYSDDYLRENLAFRGGTALHKLFMSPQPRYSEDIDLVQVKAGPIKETYDRIRDVLAFLGEPKVKQNTHNNTLIYRLMSDGEPQLPIRLKAEINCKEHFSVFPMQYIPFSVDNEWFSGLCKILTYQFEELIGTKLRALYQRRKGRDLFDLYKALTLVPELDDNKVIECYQAYMNFVVDHVPTYKEFVANMAAKLQDSEFLGDTAQLLRIGDAFGSQEVQDAYALVKSRFIDKFKRPEDCDE